MEQVGATKDGQRKYRLSDAEVRTIGEALNHSAEQHRRHGNTAKAQQFSALAQYAGQVKRITVVA